MSEVDGLCAQLDALAPPDLPADGYSAVSRQLALFGNGLPQVMPPGRDDLCRLCEPPLVAARTRAQAAAALASDVRPNTRAERAAARDQQRVRYKYVGAPIDHKTREFCTRFIDQVKTEAEWHAIWRGEWWVGKAGDNPFVYKGGYRCRHRFERQPD